MSRRRPASDASVAHYESVRDDANDYAETVWTLIGFAAFVCHDGRAHRDGSAFGFGRRMSTSSGNAVQPNSQVTPDCVAQKSGDYGVVAEVKKAFPLERSYWGETLTQLRKYDDELRGWWTEGEAVSASDAVLLAHNTRSRALVRFIEERVEEDEAAAGRNTAVVEFTKQDERTNYVFFRLEWGRIRDAELLTKLEEGIAVPMKRVLTSFPSVKYYDAEPPVEELIKNLWIDSFPSMFDASDPNRPLPVVVSDLTEELQRAYGSQRLRQDERSSEFPKVLWVRRALDTLVSLGLATNSGDSERYLVNYRVFPADVDVLQYFCFQTAQAAPRRDSAQLPLFASGSRPADPGDVPEANDAATD